MDRLDRFTTFRFHLAIPSCKIGKEGLHQAFITLIAKQDSVFTGWWKKWSNEGDKMTCQYSSQPFSNLWFEENIIITDDGYAITYTERTDQQTMLPNIRSYVYLMLLTVKTAEIIHGGFDKRSVTCEVGLTGNADIYFYEKYSLFAVDYSHILKYRMDNNMSYKMDLEQHEDIYMLFNRFYQQYKSENSTVMPYVNVVKESFHQIYDSI